MTEFNVVIREAKASDARQLAKTSRKIGSETDFLIMDEAGLALPEKLLADQLEKIAKSPDDLLLVAIADEQMIGFASVKTEGHWQTAHVGEIGISILKEFWGLGLGSILMEEILQWSLATKTIQRLELTVQINNARAIKLYEKFDFEKEGQLKKAVKLRNGDFTDVIIMGCLL